MMMRRLLLFIAALLVSPGMVYAQSTAMPVVSGYLSTSGCPAGQTTCFVQYGPSSSGSNPAAAPTGGSVPASGDYTAFSVGGVLTGVSAANPLPVTAGSGSSTPVALNAASVGGTAVTAVTGPANGCFIVNPATATEVLYVNGVTTATTTPSATTVALQAGQSWSCVPGQTTNVSVNAVTNPHVFSGQKW